MWLRNKKTGRVCDAIVRERRKDDGSYSIIVCPIRKRGPWTSLAEYPSLAKLYEEWEDYEPVEPLIKDPDIRKAVRAWAKADDLDNFRVQNQHFNECRIIGYTAGINKSSFIGFQTTIAHADDKKLYTIEELCGEEKE